MYCPHCGKERSDNDKFCAFCGAQLSTQDTDHSTESQTQNISSEHVETKTSVASNVIHKSIIEGRMGRKEFAVITIAPYLLAIVFLIFTGMTAVPIIAAWFFFGYFAAIRRLHDLNKSAWWLLLIALAMLILAIKESLELVGVDTIAFDGTILGILVNISAIAGFILLLSLLFAPGSKEGNKYGAPAVNRKITWKGLMFNLYNDSEKLDLTYFLTTAAIFFGTLMVLTAYFLS